MYRSWLMALSFTLFVLLVGSLSTACADETIATDTGGETAGVEGEIVDETEKFFEDPAALVGEEITVTVIVDEVVDPNAFRIAQRDPGGERFLVIHDGEVSPPEHSVVEVTGTVSEFNMAQVENDLGIDLDEETFELYEGEYGIVADLVDVTAD